MNSFSTIMTLLTAGILLIMVMVLLRKRDWLITLLCPRELRLLETFEKRLAANKRGGKEFFKRRSTWADLIGYCILLIVSALVLAGVTILLTQGTSWRLAGLRTAIILCVVVPFLLAPLICLRYRKWMEVFLRSYLNDCGVPICKACGYDLRGKASQQCPECGATVAPDSVSTESFKEE